MSELHYRSARSLAENIARGQITSEALVRSFMDRIARFNPSINAVVTLDPVGAISRARQRDAETACGALRGPLHGLPMTLKDTWEVAGMVSTAGAPELSEHRPKRHADIAQKLTDAGAVIIGKTNVPLYGSDLQTYNELYGVTRNPRDLTLTPGGSSGGASAALAAGLTPIEVGSDVGGSIRIPAHFNGIFGHKPTRDIVSLRGHIPGSPGSESQLDLVEAGPLARTADDLALVLEVIAGPRAIEKRYWRLQLPPCHHQTLADFRIGCWLEDRHCPLDRRVQKAYDRFFRKLKARGVTPTTPQHPLLQMERILPVYFNLLGAVLSISLTAQQRNELRWLERLLPVARPFVTLGHSIQEYVHGANEPFFDYFAHAEQREQMRVSLMSLFNEIDVLLTPISPTTAIPHDQSMPISRRRISVNGGHRPYTDQFCWIALATLLGLPATSVPIGLDDQGLPVNIQVIGAPGCDLTTIRFAELLERNGLSGFIRPRGY